MGDVMIVTGASRGIGAATALLAARQGWDVAVHYRSHGAEADAVANQVRALGRRVAVVAGDVADERDVVRLFDSVDRELGPARALVNNAGVVGQYGPTADVDAARLRRTLDVNVVGAFLCAREAIRRMSTERGASGGAIVNVSSRAAVLGGPTEWVGYAASKAAVDAMTVGLSKEVAPVGIRVNAVRPGLILTDIHEAAPPGRVERLLPGVPLGRAGTAEETAEAIVWLASEAASYVTGAFIDVGGGR
jgi:NAD(P)-dependent dehydrogenase (short-subunit alcohol dehydrogenase family)